jgi:Flp pilus assembly protein TadD
MLARLLFLCCCVGCAASAPPPIPRASMLMSKGRADEASTLLRGYLEQHPSAVEERRMLIRVEAFRGQLGAAEVEVGVLARQLGATSPIPFVEMGHALEVAHRYDEALEAYDHAAAVAPRDALGPLTGGLRAARWGELEWAEPRLREATRRNPKDATAWHALGVVQLSLGNVSGAEQAYRSGLLADPEALENRVGLATLSLSRGDLQGALVQYDAIVAKRPKLPDAHLGRAYALIGLGRYAEARAAVDEAARLGGDVRVVQAQRRELQRHAATPP